MLFECYQMLNIKMSGKCSENINEICRTCSKTSNAFYNVRAQSEINNVKCVGFYLMRNALAANEWSRSRDYWSF